MISSNKEYQRFLSAPRKMKPPCSQQWEGVMNDALHALSIFVLTDSTLRISSIVGSSAMGEKCD